MVVYPHLVAIRARLLTSPALVAYVSDRVQLQHIWDVAEPVFPLITMSQMDGNSATWGAGLTDPCRVMIEYFGQRDIEQPGEMQLLTTKLLDGLPALVSTTACRFRFINQVWTNTGYWDNDTSAWRCGAQFQVKFFSD